MAKIIHTLKSSRTKFHVTLLLLVIYSPVNIGFDLEQIATEFLFSWSVSTHNQVLQKKINIDPSGGRPFKTDFKFMPIFATFRAVSQPAAWH